ncbi:hypothetical protein V6N12_041663 [Hibiscus sabdariffa]|uniref:Uncharacterized protein n=1 Tax=Hibiscus sabdariffa TaxID=183260 RepID=A0ABR2BII4_9ROSI
MIRTTMEFIFFSNLLFPNLSFLSKIYYNILIGNQGIGYYKGMKVNRASKLGLRSLSLPMQPTSDASRDNKGTTIDSWARE